MKSCFKKKPFNYAKLHSNEEVGEYFSCFSFLLLLFICFYSPFYSLNYEEMEDKRGHVFLL